MSARTISELEGSQNLLGSLFNKRESGLWEYSSALQAVRKINYEEAIQRGLRIVVKCDSESRIAILAQPTALQFSCLASLLVRGKAAVMLNWRLPASVLKKCIKTAQPSTLVCSLALQKLATEVVQDMPQIRIICMEEEEAARIDIRIDSIVLKSTQKDQTALILYTSGSTRAPKCVALSHLNVVTACLGKLLAHERSGIAVSGSTLCFLPNFHVIGLVNNFIFNAMCNISTLVHKECETTILTIELLAQVAQRIQPCILDTVPKLLEDLAHKFDRIHERDCFSKIPLILYGGAPLSSAAMGILSTAGLRLAPHYGQTEFGGLVLIGEPSSSLGHRADAMRQPPLQRLFASTLYINLPEQKIAIENNELIVYDSPACGYYIRDENNAAPSSRKRRRRDTGDIFKRLDDEWFTHTCRKDDIIVHSTGEMTIPGPLEDAAYSILQKESGISKCLILGRGRRSPVLVLETASLAQPNREILDAAITAANAVAPAYSHLRTDRVLCVSIFPVSHKGNPLRNQLENELSPRLDELDRNDDCSNTKTKIVSTLSYDEVDAIMTHELSRILGGLDRVPEAKSPLFGVGGLDSSGLMQLVRSLARKLNTPTISPALVFDFPTRATLCQVLSCGHSTSLDLSPSHGLADAAESPRSKNIAIISSNGRFPGASESLSALNTLLQQGLTACSTVPRSRWDAEIAVPSKYRDTKVGDRLQYGAFLTEGADVFDAKYFGISPAEATAMDPQQKILLEEGERGLRVIFDQRKTHAVGVFTALMNTDHRDLILLRQQRSISAYDTTGNGPSTAAARLSFLRNLHGPCLAIDTACSSSLVALRAAVNALRQGECQAALAPTANIMLYPGPQYLGPAVMSLLSATGRCHVFDSSADGFVRAEAGACYTLIIPEEEQGCQVSACVVRHSGVAASFTAPSSQSQSTLIAAALEQAQLGDPFSRIELHGTGTALGDPIECAGLSTLVKKAQLNQLRVSAIKANIGHSEASAGAASITSALYGLNHSVPIAACLRVRNPHCNLGMDVCAILEADELTDQLLLGTKNTYGASAFGWSGILAHVILALESRGISPDAEVMPLLLAPPSYTALFRNRIRTRTTYIPSHNDDGEERAVSQVSSSETSPSQMSAPEVQSIVNKVVSAALGHNAPRDTPLMQLGLDSLAVTELTHSLESEFGLASPLPTTLVFDCPTVNELTRFLLLKKEHIKPIYQAARPMAKVQTNFKDISKCAAVSARSFVMPSGVSDRRRLRDVVQFGLNLGSVWPMTRWHDVDFAPTSAKYGAFVHDEALYGFSTPCYGMTPAELKTIDPRQMMITRYSVDALKSSSVYGSSDIGVFVGLGGVFSNKSSSSSRTSTAFDSTSSPSLAGSQLSVASGRVSFYLNLTGPCLSIDTACSSSLTALHLANAAIQSNECSASLAIGVNLMSNANDSIELSRLGMLSTQGRCFTFDKRADGYARGEGCNAIVLTKSEESFSSDANVVSTQTGSDGISVSLTAPNGAAQKRLLMSLAQPCCASTVLEAHGTGTRLGDPIELGAAASALVVSGFVSTATQVQSLKGNVGHLEHAAGTSGLLALLEASLIDGTVANNSQLRILNPHIGAHLCDNKASSFVANIDLAPQHEAVDGECLDGRVSSFGFSGTIVHARFEQRVQRCNDFEPVMMLSYSTLSDRNSLPLTKLTHRCVASVQVVSSPTRISRSTLHYDKLPATTAGTTMIEKVRSCVRQALGVDIAPDDSFMSVVDGDSLTLAMVSSHIADTLGVKLQVTSLFDFPTLRELVAHLTEDEVSVVPVASTNNFEMMKSFCLESYSATLPGGATSSAALFELAKRSVDTFSHVPSLRWTISESMSSTSAHYGSFFLAPPCVAERGVLRMSAAELASTDYKQVLIISECYSALKQSALGVGADAQPGFERTNVFVGAVGLLNGVNTHDASNHSVYAPTGHSFAVASGRVSYAFGLQGISVALDTACSTSLVALHLASQSLVMDQQSRALVSTVSFLEESTHNLVANAGMLSARGKCHTLDTRADGYARSDGVLAFVIASRRERLQQSHCYDLVGNLSTDKCLDEEILCILGPMAVQQDGSSASLTAPNGNSQRRLMKDVAHKINATLCDRVAIYEAHGTGTALGDPIEVGASHAALTKQCNTRLHFQSLKGNVGHMEPSAAGSALLAVKHALIDQAQTPNAQLRCLNSHLVSYLKEGIGYTAGVAITPTSVQDARISSFGFSGTIAHAQVALHPSGMAICDEDTSFRRFDGESFPWRPAILRDELCFRAQADSRRQQHEKAHQQLTTNNTKKRPQIANSSKIIVEAVTEALGYKIGSHAEPLMAAGLDSLALSEIHAQLCVRLNLNLPATLLFDCPSIDDIIAYVDTGQSCPDEVSRVEIGDTGSIKRSLIISSISFSLPGAIDTRGKLIDLVSNGVSTCSTVPLVRWDSTTWKDRAPASLYGSFTDAHIYLDAAQFDISPHDAATNDPQQIRLLEMCYAALRAGTPGLREQGRAAFRKKDYGIFAGATGVTWREDDLSYIEQRPKVHQCAPLGLTLSVMAGRVSYALGLTGPSVALDTACSTTLVTLHLASNAVKNGECSRAVSAGSIFLREHVSAVLAVNGMLSNSGRCHTFDKRADGYLRGEGAIAYVLDRDDSEEIDKPRIIGSAVRQDGPSANLSSPNGSSQRALIQAVRRQASSADEEIILEAHGTGTMLGDPIEIGSAVDALGQRSIRVQSLKANMGHLETSAGGAGCAALLLSTMQPRVFQNAELFTINTHVASLITLKAHFCLPVENVPVGKTIGRINSFGFSGTIAHVLLQQGTTVENVMKTADINLFRTTKPYRPFLCPQLVSMQCIRRDILTKYDRQIPVALDGASTLSRIVRRRSDIRGTLIEIFEKDFGMDYNSVNIMDIDSIALTQLVSTINDSFGIESEIGSYLVLDDIVGTEDLVASCCRTMPLPETMHQESTIEMNLLELRLLYRQHYVEIEHRSKVRNEVASICVFVHDESGTCAYMKENFHGPALILSTSTILSIQAPELARSSAMTRILNFGDRVSHYASDVSCVVSKLLRSEDVCAEYLELTFVGCGAAVDLARALATHGLSLEGISKVRNRVIAIDPSVPLTKKRRGLVQFARAFYNDYVCTMLGFDQLRRGAILKATSNASNYVELQSLLMKMGALTSEAIEELDLICEYMYNAFEKILNPAKRCEDEIIVQTCRGRALVVNGWRTESVESADRVYVDDLNVVARYLGLEENGAGARKFAYVPFVNRMDIGDCLKCWKKERNEAPSVCFVHGGIGICGIATNYTRMLPEDVGLYVIQAPEHQTGDYDWAPTPKERAEFYLSICLEHIPFGAVFVGYSFAGNIVFEMALLVQAQSADYPFEFFLLEPVPPSVPTRIADSESLLEHNARFVDKILCEEFLPAVFGFTDVIHLDAIQRVADGRLRSNTQLLHYVIDKCGLDQRFASDFERMMEFIYHLKLEKPTGIYSGDVNYLLILPHGYRHYELYWSYSGPLADPWKPYIDGKLIVHSTLQGNHFQAFDSEQNLNSVKAICDPLLDKLWRRYRTK